MEETILSSNTLAIISCWVDVFFLIVEPLELHQNNMLMQEYFSAADDEIFVPSCRGGVHGDVFVCIWQWQCITYLGDLYTNHGLLSTYYHGMILQFIWFLYAFCMVPYAVPNSLDGMTLQVFLSKV